MTDQDMTAPLAVDEVGYFSDEAATFGDRLAAARRAVGLEQETLSRKLGIKLKTLRAWEDDVSEPRANKLQMLAGVLNVSIIWILTGEGEGVQDPWDEATPQPCPDMDELLTEMRLVHEEYKRLGARLVRLQKRLKAAAAR